MRGQWFVLGTFLILFVFLTSFYLAFSPPQTTTAPVKIPSLLLDPEPEKLQYLCDEGLLWFGSRDCYIDPAILQCGLTVSFRQNGFEMKTKIKNDSTCEKSLLYKPNKIEIAEINVSAGCYSAEAVTRASMVYTYCKNNSTYLRGLLLSPVFLCLNSSQSSSLPSIAPVRVATGCNGTLARLNFSEVPEIYYLEEEIPPLVFVTCSEAYSALTHTINTLLNRGSVVMGYRINCGPDNCCGSMVETPTLEVKGRHFLENLTLHNSTLFLRNCPFPLAVAKEDPGLASICLCRSGKGLLVFFGNKQDINNETVGKILEYLSPSGDDLEVMGCG